MISISRISDYVVVLSLAVSVVKTEDRRDLAEFYPCFYMI